MDLLDECMTREIKVEKEFQPGEKEALCFYNAYETSKVKKTDLLVEYMTQEIKYEKELQIEEEEDLHFHNTCEIPETGKVDLLEKCLTQEVNEKESQLEKKEETLYFYNIRKASKVRKIYLSEEDKDKEYLPEEHSNSVELVSSDYKKQAVEYWKSSKRKPRSLESVRHRFRKVTSAQQLRRWKVQIDKGGSRLEKLNRITVYTLNCFNEAQEKGITIRDIDIAQWASQAQKEENVPGFKVSKSWVRRFKVRLGLL
ncbi:PREDICTED: uncharacterized protein LOC106749714 isoform X2 [Dinoponera quadriceps]|uniref:Uncharacterized protein LOC106749714 isoform X2 n=1 Tax=Dinoponera quadriceps TaxID=609295 RepID=A0A6P3Y468_DINQU|nr:PREDICTED: uncharacterized protein LOC106749714 isoform X2 [Dinoponera quadriceps]